MTSAASTQQFQHFSLKHKMIAWVSTNLFDSATYTVRNGLLKGMKRRGGLGWAPEILSRSESAEDSFWRMLPLAGKTVYDIGAFHGLLTLHFGRKAKRVIAYEPMKANHARLAENVGLNDLRNVVIQKKGLGAEKGNAMIAFSPLTPGGAKIGGAGTEQEAIAVTTLDAEIAEGMPVPDFIKIDTEGLELEVLKGARRTLIAYRPTLFLEMHGETMAEKQRKVSEIVMFLEDLGYETIRHVETGRVVTRANAHIAARGHLHVM